MSGSADVPPFIQINDPLIADIDFARLPFWKRADDSQVYSIALRSDFIERLGNFRNECRVGGNAIYACGFYALLYRYLYQEKIPFYINELLPNGAYRSVRVSMTACSERSVYEHCSALDLLISSTENHCQSGARFSGAALLFLDKALSSAALQLIIDEFASQQGVILLVVEPTGIDRTLHMITPFNAECDLAQRGAQHYLRLIEQLILSPEASLLKFSPVTEDERAAIEQYSKGPLREVGEQPFVRQFEGLASRQGHAVAVQFEEESLSYAQLNRQANQVADELLRFGIIKGQAVISLCNPGFEVLVFLLAIHKVGAVYVALDPSLPILRMEAILQEVQPVLILSNLEATNVPALLLDKCRFFAAQDIACEGECENPEVDLHLDDTSHIFFTSGTTGRPKGVVSSHRNLVHYIANAIGQYQFNAEDRFLSAARYTFSICFFELLVPLACGARVKLLARNTVLNMGALAKEVSQATAFHFGPGLLKQLLPYIDEHFVDKSSFHQLRHVSSGGDIVGANILEWLKSIFVNAEVYVIYGSSEISCMGCTYFVPRSEIIRSSKIGRPHQNVQLRLLDNNGTLVPAGVPGMLSIAGPGVVTGYLNQPSLTSEKFTLVDGYRFYQMGDVARWDLEGNLEILGRQDFQVQIHGVRIEIQEIEYYLKQLESIADCVVVARQWGDDGDLRLVAYVVFKAQQELSASTLSEHLALFLPDFMVPNAFMVLSALPTNFNGKLDRGQLPAPNGENLLLSEKFEGATNATEKALVALWCELFAVAKVGVNNSFFELGGDSLLAVRMLVAIDKRFQCFIPISFLVDSPTIRDLAAVIDGHKTAEGVGEVVVLKSGNDEAPLFCLYGVLLYRDLANALKSDRMVCAVYLDEEVLLMKDGLDSQKVADFLNVDYIAEQYLQRITAFQTQGPYYLAGESFGGIIALEVARKLRARGEHVGFVGMFDSNTPGFYESASRVKKIIGHCQMFLKRGPRYLLTKWNKRKFALLSGEALASGAVHLPDDYRESARKLASKSYLPETYAGDVVLFKARIRDPFEPHSNDLGWGKYLPQLIVHEVSGDHIGILKDGNVSDLATKLLPYLR